MTSAQTKAPVDERARLIKLIHVGKRELVMDEDAYRDILRTKTKGKKDSTKDMSVRELEAVLAHMRSAGFAVRVKGNSVKHPAGSRPLADDEQSKMMRGIWLELHGMSIVRDSSESALASFVCRHTKIDALQWLTSKQASSMIEHLKKWRNRILGDRTRALWKALGLSHEPDMDALSGVQQRGYDLAERALGRRVDPILQTQADFDLVIAAGRKMQ